MYKFRQFYIPDRMMDGLIRYIELHCPVGSFLTAVLENNLNEACYRADDENISNLPAYVAYLYNAASSQCYGSHEKVTAWLAQRHVDHHGDKPDGRPDMHVSTGPGDLDVAGRPLRPGS